MTKPMKVLIGYDGSTYADAAIDDLRTAGLPSEVEALVVSIGDAPSIPPLTNDVRIDEALVGRRVVSIVNHADTHVYETLAEAREHASAARRQLESYFPNWDVRELAVGGRPATELIQEAGEWAADLLVVGCQGRSAVGRLIFGSVSLECAIDSPCSVRIGRAFKSARDAPRIVVGVASFAASERTINHVLKRSWPEGTELRIIVVDDGQAPAGNKPRGLMELARGESLKVFANVRTGDPATILIAEAIDWSAHCIFVDVAGFGATSDDSTVSTQLAKNADCSVEIVR